MQLLYAEIKCSKIDCDNGDWFIYLYKYVQRKTLNSTLSKNILWCIVCISYLSKDDEKVYFPELWFQKIWSCNFYRSLLYLPLFPYTMLNTDKREKSRNTNKNKTLENKNLWSIEKEIWEIRYRRKAVVCNWKQNYLTVIN